MLLYFGSGSRRYDLNPIRIFTRNRWSFQIVLEGEIAMLEAGGPGFLKTKHLWLCRPEFPHGWTASTKKNAEVAVFQFVNIPVDLARMLPKKDFFDADLTPDQCQRIKLLAKNMEKYWRVPLPGRMLYFEHALMELSVIVHESLELETHPECFRPPHNQSRVIKAIHWFERNIATNPTLEQIASASGVSTSQMRRDFLSILHINPKKAFDDIRLKMALEHLQLGSDTVDNLATKFGFSSTSSFSRAFKNKFGHSPREFFPPPLPRRKNP